jgi:uncharacterized RDD family membrane protein YckC
MVDNPQRRPDAPVCRRASAIVSDMSELVTGEAVVLDLRFARLASRGLAFAIDLLIQLAGLVILFIVLAAAASGLDDALVGALGIVIAVFVFVGYPVTLETLTRGRTVGKMALGLRVVREDGGPIRFRQALVRGVVWFFVDFWVFGLGGAVAIFVSLASAKGKRVGDFLAGTVVVRERVAATVGPAVGMPPGMAAWASEVDVLAVPDGLALAVRQYLSRYGELNDGARESLGGQLAAQVSRYLGVPVPTDGWAPTYLAAVLAERRAREQSRLRPPPAVAPPVAQPLPPEPRPEPPASGPFAAPG